jgi:YtkA-like
MPSRHSRSFAERPGVAGPLHFKLLLVPVLLLVPALATAAHGLEFEVVVEAVNRSKSPEALSYGIVLTFADGHEVADAVVTVTARMEGGEPAEETKASMTTPGVYIADLTLAEGSWQVGIDIVTGDSEGTIEFTEVVGSTPMSQPVVRVDTAEPGRQGEVVAQSSVFEPAAAPAGVPVTDIDVRVEALVRDAVAPLLVEYGVVTGVTDAMVSISALSEGSPALGPVALTETADGVFQGVLEYPAGGVWEVSVGVEGSGGGTAAFAENLPWPHYTTEAGSPKIKVDSADPSLQGTLIEIGESPIFGQAGSATTVPGTTAPAQHQGEVVVSLPTSGSEIGFQVMLRWVHLAGIGVWATAIAAVGLGRKQGIWAVLAISGMVATIATGGALALWGAPTDFPGIFDWSELGARLYGSAYQWAFLIKMGFVLTAVIATSMLIAKSGRGRLAVAAGGMLGALAAVVVMAQLHVFAHL